MEHIDSDNELIDQGLPMRAVGPEDRLGVYMDTLNVVRRPHQAIYETPCLINLALRTGNAKYTEICRRLADVFLANLHSTGVPRWLVSPL